MNLGLPECPECEGTGSLEGGTVCPICRPTVPAHADILRYADRLHEIPAALPRRGVQVEEVRR